MAMKSTSVGVVDAVNRDDVRMVQCGRRLGFANKSALSVGIGVCCRWQDLDGDEPTEAGIAGFVDHAHPAFTERPEDLVVREGLTNHEPVVAQERSMATIFWRHDLTTPNVRRR